MSITISSIMQLKAFILAWILLATICIKTQAQPKISVREHQADARIIKNYIHSLNVEMVMDTSIVGIEILEGKKPTPEFIDSLIGESREGYRDGNVCYSPDKKFKIFTITGESCGMHCNCFYQAYLHFNSSKKGIVLASGFFPVDAIYKLNDGKYLIIQKASTCGGTVFYNYKRATLISFKKSKVVYHPFVYGIPFSTINKNTIEKDGGLGLSQLIDDEHESPDSLVLRFDPKSNGLQYKYLAYADLANMSEAFTFSGYFHYEKGRFVLKNESKKKYVHR